METDATIKYIKSQFLKNEIRNLAKIAQQTFILQIVFAKKCQPFKEFNNVQRY